MCNPVFTYVIGNEFGKIRIIKLYPSSWSNAIRNTKKFLRVQVIKILHHKFLQQFRMQCGHAIYCVTANAGKMRHTYIARSFFPDNRNAAKHCLISASFRFHIIEKTAVDFVNYFQMTWQ